MRLSDWRSRLHAVVAARMRRPFAWGDDCASFAGESVEAVTGIDFYAPFRGKYDDAIGAMRVIAGAGFNDLAELVAELFPEIAPANAEIGDLAIIDEAGRPALGVFVGERIGCVTPDRGYGTVERERAVRALKVG